MTLDNIPSEKTLLQRARNFLQPVEPEKKSISFKNTLLSVVNGVITRTELEKEIQDVQTALSSLREGIKIGNTAAISTAQTLLEQYFYLNVGTTKLSLPGDLTFHYPVAVLQRFHEPLKKYISESILRPCDEHGIVSTGDIDHGIYLADLVDKTYDQKRYPAFTILDQRIARQDLEWKVSLVRTKKEQKSERQESEQQGSALVVRPIRTIDELVSFESCGNIFCVLDPQRGGAQLYLYAAHAHVRLLGVWKKNAIKEEALGILPFLMMRNRNKKPQEKSLERIPWLYLEAVMLDAKILDSSVYDAKGKKILFREALENIIVCYAALQYEIPFPELGCLLRAKVPYSSSIRSFVGHMVAEFSSGRHQNKVCFGDLNNGIKKREVMFPKYYGSKYLELPEDEKLLDCLKTNGYRLPYTILNSQAFLKDEERNKTRLCGEWGLTQGYTTTIPFLDFYDILIERWRETSAKKVKENAV